MSPADTTATMVETKAASTRGTTPVEPRATAGKPHVPESVVIEGLGSEIPQLDVVPPDEVREREHFIPVTRFALTERLTSPSAWPPGQSVEARRLFSYLDYWRRQRYGARMLELDQTYEPFNPDSDLLMTRSFTDAELEGMQERLVSGVRQILTQANYKQIDPKSIAEILTQESHYGLDLHVDFSLFEECQIYYRGASTRKDQKRMLRKFLRKEEFDVPIFQRLFLLYKLKTLDVRIRGIMQQEKISRKEAERMAKKQRAHLPAAMVPGNIYMKLFKNIPRYDIEMVFPNTEVKYRMLDKIMLSGGGIAGLGGPIVGAVTKFGALANPFVAVPLVIGFGGAVFRGAMNFVNKRNKYMIVMAQNLYFHSLADNRGALILIIDRAAEEDVKEELLLYSVLAKEKANRRDLPAIDVAIEQYLKTTFGLDVDFDLEDALSRLLADGIVTEDANGDLHTLPPREAGLHIDEKWDSLLDNLPDVDPHEGLEMDVDKLRAENGATLSGSVHT